MFWIWSWFGEVLLENAEEIEAVDEVERYHLNTTTITTTAAAAAAAARLRFTCHVSIS